MPAPPVICLEPFNGGLAFMRSLRRRGYRVTAVVPPELGYMGLARGVRAVGVAEAEEAFAPALQGLAAEGDAVVVTGADRSTAWLAEHRSELPAGLKTFEGPGSGHLDLIGKERAYEIATAAGVAVPWMRPVSTAEELAAAADEAPYPCVLKPVVSHVFRILFGDERVFLVDDAAQARQAGERALEAGIPMMMSEYVPGGDGDVEEAIVVRAADGSYPVAFGCRKIRQQPKGFGAASICVSDPIGPSMELARAVLDEAGFVGVCGVETKVHPGTGVPYFIEANVRLPTQWGLGDASGAEASARLVATLNGEDPGPQPPVRAGVKLVFPELEMRAAAGALRSVSLGRRPGVLLDLLRTYRGVREVGLLDPRDPAPLLSRLGFVGRKWLRRHPEHA